MNLFHLRKKSSVLRDELLAEKEKMMKIMLSKCKENQTWKKIIEK